MTKKKLFSTLVGSDVILESFESIGELSSVSFENRDLEVFQMSNQDLLGFIPYLDADQNSVEVLDFFRGLYHGNFWYIMSLFKDPTESEIDPRFMPVIDGRYEFITKRFIRSMLHVAESAFQKIMVMPRTTIVKSVVSKNSQNINNFASKKVVQKLGYNADMAYICTMLLKIINKLADKKQGFISDWLFEEKQFNIKLYAGTIEYQTIEQLYTEEKNKVESIFDGNDINTKPDKFFLDKLLKNVRA